jgi:hypothetical protein
LIVDWTPRYYGSELGGTLSYSFDATGKTSSYSISSARSTFGSTEVRWGFTGATGAQSSINAVALKSYPAAAKATVIVTHKDRDTGAVLHSDTYSINPGNYGPYGSMSFPGYESGTLASGSSQPSGTIAANQTINITYLYSKKPTTGRVNIYHKDADTGAILHTDSYNLNPGNYGPYGPMSFPGYESGTLAPGSAQPSGTIASNQTVNITYLYAKKPIVGTINVYHKDVDTGANLFTDTLTVSPGYYGTFSPLTFQNYNPGYWDTSSAPPYGYIAAGQTLNVTFLYKKLPVNATIYVIHNDITNGGIILLDIYSVTPGYYGPYRAKVFENYSVGEWDPNSASISGTISAGQTIFIAYLYEYREDT